MICEDAYNLVAEEKVGNFYVEPGFTWHSDSRCTCNRKSVRTIDMVDLLFINSHAELPELIEASDGLDAYCAGIDAGCRVAVGLRFFSWKAFRPQAVAASQ